MHPSLRAGALAATFGLFGAGGAAAQCGLIVFFNSGQAGVGSAATNTLTDYVAANPGVQLDVTGYSDAAGSAAVNQRLSQRRAEAVAAVLRNEAGATVVDVTGAGEAVRPDTSGPEDPRNRRVEVVDTRCEGGLFAGTPGTGTGGLVGNEGIAVAGGIGALGILAAVASDDDDDSAVTGATGTD